MSFVLNKFLLATTLLAMVFSSSAVGEITTDYDLLKHALSIEKLRAGIHDEKGINDYYFKLTLLGLLNTKEERDKEMKDRKQVEESLGEFGDIKIPSLKYWKPDKEVKYSKRVIVDGESIRALASRTMREFEVGEDQVAVMIRVTMLERNKKFVFFGDDILISEAHYYPVPQTSFDVPGQTNLSLSIKDDKGTIVILHVDYETPIAKDRVQYPKLLVAH